MISVIMPVWNGARFIDRAIASVVAQTHAAWELLIIDDGSTDDSPARAAHWRDLVNGHLREERIRLFSTDRPRSGPAVGRNIAAEHARYDLFAYLDVDDLFFPRRLESVVPLFDRYDMIFSPYEIQEKGRLNIWNLHGMWQKRSYVCNSEGDREPPFSAWMRGYSQRANPSIPLGVAHRRRFYEEVGGFQPGVVVGEDGILWRRMADRVANIGFCPVIAGRYHVRADSLARTRTPLATGGHEIRKDDPLGSNGQYLDADWFAALEKRKRG